MCDHPDRPDRPADARLTLSDLQRQQIDERINGDCEAPPDLRALAARLREMRRRVEGGGSVDWNEIDEAAAALDRAAQVELEMRDEAWAFDCAWATDGTVECDWEDTDDATPKADAIEAWADTLAGREEDRPA